MTRLGSPGVSSWPDVSSSVVHGYFELVVVAGTKMATSPRVCHEAKAIYVHRWSKTLLSCPCAIHTAYCKGLFRNSKGKCSSFEVGLSVRLCASLRLSARLWASLGACSDGQFDGQFHDIIIFCWKHTKNGGPVHMLPRGT